MLVFLSRNLELVKKKFKKPWKVMPFLFESGTYINGSTSIILVFCPVAGFMYTNTVWVGHFIQSLDFSGAFLILRLYASSWLNIWSLVSGLHILTYILYVYFFIYFPMSGYCNFCASYFNSKHIIVLNTWRLCATVFLFCHVKSYFILFIISRSHDFQWPGLMAGYCNSKAVP